MDAFANDNGRSNHGLKDLFTGRYGMTDEDRDDRDRNGGGGPGVFFDRIDMKQVTVVLVAAAIIFAMIAGERPKVQPLAEILVYAAIATALLARR